MSGKLRPCVKCGGEKQPGQGRRYCEDCQALARWTRETKFRTRSLLVRQPCQKCGGAKPAGKGHRYCVKCKPDLSPRRCIDCGTEIQRPYLKCHLCKAHTAERERIRHRERSRLRNARLAAAGKATTHDRDRDRDNETRRIRRREKAERAGRLIPELPVDLYEQHYGDGRGKTAPRVNAEPLLPWLNDENIVDVAFRAGIDDSYLYRVLRGAQRTLSLRDADRLCIAVDTTFDHVFGLAQIA